MINMKKITHDWRRKELSRIRTLIEQADPAVVEEVKWRKPSNPAGVPVWSHGGMICTGEMYNDHLRFTFAKGNLLWDQKDLFNSFRAIIIHEGDKINGAAFKNLIRAAVALNLKSKSKPKPRRMEKEKTG
jgi:hypothetical protein